MKLLGTREQVSNPLPAGGAAPAHADARAKGLWRVVSKVSLLITVGAVFMIGQAAPVQAQTAAAPVCPPGQECPCTWSAWLNRDAPSGVGDYETLVDFVKEGVLKCRRPLAIQCRYRPNGAVWGSQVASYPGTNTAGAGYHCETANGGWCKNTETKPPGSQSKPTCKDSEVRFCCLPE